MNFGFTVLRIRVAELFAPEKKWVIVVLRGIKNVGALIIRFFN